MSFAMVCETCQQKNATVHLTGSRRIETSPGESSSNESFEHHLCESCAANNPLANPALRRGPDAICETLRVVNVTVERTVVRLVRTESDAAPEEWTFLTSRLPAEYAAVRLEFEISWSPSFLKRLKGEG